MGAGRSGSPSAWPIERFGNERQRVRRKGVQPVPRRCASAPDWAARLAKKRAARAADEAAKPLADYRAEELERMRLNFYGFDPSYHVARYNFVRRVPKSRTPITIARHRDKRIARSWRNAS